MKKKIYPRQKENMVITSDIVIPPQIPAKFVVSDDGNVKKKAIPAKEIKSNEAEVL